MKRSTVIEALREYFILKGKVLTCEEYKNADNAPIRFQIVKRTFGTWNRTINSLGPIEFKKEEKPVVKQEVIKNEIKKPAIK